MRGCRLEDCGEGLAHRARSRFHDATGKDLVVTDGARTPKDQAERMHHTAFSGKVGTGFPSENALNQKLTAVPRFNKSGNCCKYAHGDFRTYRGKFAEKIANAYREGVKNNLSRNQILTKMAAIAADSVSVNQPISYHLANRAVDFSSKSLTGVENRVLKSIIAKNGGVPLHEGAPKHVHATFRKD